MVNQKRVEQKLPLLMTDGPWWSSELDRNEIRLKKFKRCVPNRYVLHRNNILNELDALRKEMDDYVKSKKRNNR